MGALIRAKDFTRRERGQRGREDDVGHYDDVSLEEPQLTWKFTAVR